MSRNRALTAISSFPKVTPTLSNSISLQNLSHSNKIITLLKNFSSFASERLHFYNDPHLTSNPPQYHHNHFENPHLHHQPPPPTDRLYTEPQSPTNAGNNNQVCKDRTFSNGYSQSSNNEVHFNDSVVGNCRGSGHSQNPNGNFGGGGGNPVHPQIHSMSSSTNPQIIPNMWDQGRTLGVQGNQNGAYSSNIGCEFTHGDGYRVQLNSNGYHREDAGNIRQKPNDYQFQPKDTGNFQQKPNVYQFQSNLNGHDREDSRNFQHRPNGYQFQPSSNGYHREGSGNFQQDSSAYQFQPNSNANYDSGNSNAEIAESSLYGGTIEELDGFCQENKIKEAVEVLELLEKKGVTVDFLRYVKLIEVCGDFGVLKYAKYVHDQMIKSTGHIEVNTQNKILEMYSKCGSMSDAYAMFEKMSERNLTSWDTMITGLAKNGLGEDAVDLFTQFKEAGLKPDGRMFIGIFSACSVLGDINEGMLHFESMQRVYGIVPSMEHYVSVVNMLGSAGYMDEAMDFIEAMPIEPNVDVWETLMNLCRVHGNMELGDQCAEIVNYLDPSHLTDKSKEGLLPVKASKLLEERDKRNSSINLPDVKNSRVHEYRAGDTSHPDNHILYTLLKRMSAQMKEAGYVPDIKPVLHDVDQETKEEALLSHSERLAVAQGLITSASRSPIRVIKNLRICMDCHNSMKIISKIVGRELIMRDAKRFHHFKDGLCSCKDYW